MYGRGDELTGWGAISWVVKHLRRHGFTELQRNLLVGIHYLDMEDMYFINYCKFYYTLHMQIHCFVLFCVARRATIYDMLGCHGW